MPEEPLIPRHRVGRTFGIALWALGVFAVLQLLAVAWGIVGRIDLAAAEKASAGSGDAAGGEATVPEASVEETPPPESGTAESSAVAVTPDPAIEAGAWQQNQVNLEITDPKVTELFEAGESLRKRGDLPGALARFKEADALLPKHPAILYEIADLYEFMGLKDKAEVEWEKIFDLGTEGAGDFWLIADVNLRGEGTKESTMSDALLTVTKVVVQRHPEVTDGEKVTLRIALKGKPGVQIVPNDVVVNVFFFDLVNGSDVARTTADEPRYFWSTPPIDWKGQPEEILEVEYFHPVLTPQEVQDLGERRYHGHIVEVYYRDQLQDVVAQPRTLRNLAVESTNPLMQNRLFPTN